MDHDDSICPLPWLNLSIDVDGSSRPCCKFAHLRPDSPYQLANLREHSLEEVWNAPAMVRLRKDFAAGVRPVECSSCWNEEAAGIRSFRQTYLDDRGIRARPDYGDFGPAQPVGLDLKLSNACNLRCRICGPTASSSWLTEELSNPDLAESTRVELLGAKRYLLSNKLTDDPRNSGTLRAWAASVEHLELTGGEPMFCREYPEVIDTIAEHGDLGDVTMVVTTNGMVVDERIFAHFDDFRWVTITVSVDDVGARLEYQRAPAKWSTVAANLARYGALASERVRVWVNCSVSIFNVWYVPEVVDWIEAAYPEGAVRMRLNMVHGPEHFNVRSMPVALKEVVADRLRLAARDRSTVHDLGPQMSELVEFMMEPEPEPGAWTRGLGVIAERDLLRGESFADVAPEFVEAARGVGAWLEEAEALPTREPTPTIRSVATRIAAPTRRLARTLRR
ncbi:MAG: twitch domain-containing radical SAM protein [Microthrixaceae bacterium]